MEEIKILGLSGKKQSGKNLTANYIIGCFLKTLEIISGDFRITAKGELWVPDLFGDTDNQGIFDITEDSDDMRDFCKNHLDSIVKVYSFADMLKQEVCMKVLGLTRAQCYGTDADKNVLTHLRWENMPGVITEETLNEEGGNALCMISTRDDIEEIQETLSCIGLYFHPSGPMSAREVMQYVGTEIFRKMYGNVWVDATVRKIQEDRPLMAIITDVRFINEVEGINTMTLAPVLTPLESAGFPAYPVYEVESVGKVLRLTRDVFKGQDQHESETALDNYPLENYAFVLDNDKMSVAEQCVALQELLEQAQWLPKVMQS